MLNKNPACVGSAAGSIGSVGFGYLGWHPERPSDRYDCMGLVWTVSLITRPLGNPKLVALWQAMAQAGDSEPVTSTMIAAGISQLPPMDMDLSEISELLTNVYRAMRRLRGMY
jgi:hypothetical protein